MILAHWTYTREEWKNFRRSNEKKRGFVGSLIHKIMPMYSKKIPEIQITPEQVLIGGRRHILNDPEQTLRSVDVREEGPVNIIEIKFNPLNTGEISIRDIRIPVPKGRLREALEIQTRLLSGE